MNKVLPSQYGDECSHMRTICTCVTVSLFVSDIKMPQWASAEGGGSEAESPDQMMLYYEDETSQYFDNKPDIADKIEQAGGKIILHI